jgi:uncharacterized phage protein (TIGR02220 family)
MSKIVIPTEFIEALGELPPMYRLMWMEWLKDPKKLFSPTFCDKTKYSNVPKEKVKECYDLGMGFFKEGFIFLEDYLENKKSKPIAPPLVDDNSVKEIIDYLNEVANTQFKYNTKVTLELIKARLKEGYTINQFKEVIRKKTNQWKNTEFASYIRPLTLFSTKFESYLNQPENVKPKPTSNFKQTSNAINEAKAKLFD